MQADVDVHATGGCPTQAPAPSHVDCPAHAVPAVQTVPAAAGVSWQPRAASHVAMTHGPGATHVRADPAVQMPLPSQEDAPLQTLLSVSQLVPDGAFATTHPIAGSHEAVAHGPADAHATDVPPVHAPFAQTAPAIQRLLPSHDWPFGAGGFEHAPVEGSHVPAV